MDSSPKDPQSWLFIAMEVMATVFIVAIGFIFLALIFVFILDKFQTKQAIRRNYPLIGWFRYLFEDFGIFFRQYFFAMDREEMPFNREQRSWSYRAAKNLANTVPFGSTKVISSPGTILFLNAPFPVLEQDTKPPGTIVFGPDCKTPYKTNSIFNISAMSCSARMISLNFRINVRSLLRKKFFATCMVMVLPPD